MFRLAHNKIGDNAGIALGNGLRENRSIELLKQVTLESNQALTPSESSSSYVLLFSLDSNSVGDIGAKAIGEGLKVNTSLGCFL